MAELACGSRPEDETEFVYAHSVPPGGYLITDQTIPGVRGGVESTGGCNTLQSPLKPCCRAATGFRPFLKASLSRKNPQQRQIWSPCHIRPSASAIGHLCEGAISLPALDRRHHGAASACLSHPWKYRSGQAV